MVLGKVERTNRPTIRNMATQEADRAAQATATEPSVVDVKMIIGGEQVDAADG